ncbi:DUF6794 domain-containing protein [Candidatus Soleaferrea massiliensis]|uniref:DUF6794 domain-containing protein n=1 Tax=Candidatus Soleaferrea massiliensis TaxID=1470354 RepID=UPI00058DD47D|nr:DUF6794 domain-containing protein [Candidatus Soleaferrea massiliensis]
MTKSLYKYLKNSFPEIEKLFSEAEMERFKNTPPEDLYLYHFGLGTWIRNNLITQDKKLFKMFLWEDIWHIDDMSDIVIREFQRYCKDK